MAMSSLLRIARKLCVRLVQRACSLIFIAASMVVPRSKRLWVFGSWYGQRFADNTKHFFLYCNQLDNCPVKPIWLSRNPRVVQRIRDLGFRAHFHLSPLGLWFRLRAGVYLIDCRVLDIGSVAGRGAKVVNLWHGVPLKKIERDIEQPHHPVVQARTGSLPVRLANKLLRPQLTERYHLVLATSRVTAERFASAFGVTPEQLVVAGYPRTDPLLASEHAEAPALPEERHLVEELQGCTRAGWRSVLYMPTFRDWNNITGRDIPIDWSALDEILMAEGGVLYCKLHPADQARIPTPDHFSRIRMVPVDFDVYTILKYTDALITDYSSVFFDYLILDKPVLFYPYDLDDYQRFSRTLYDPYESVTPGPKAYTPQELGHLLRQLLTAYPEVTDCWREQRARVRMRVDDFADGRASERLLAALLEKFVS